MTVLLESLASAPPNDLGSMILRGTTLFQRLLASDPRLARASAWAVTTAGINALTGTPPPPVGEVADVVIAFVLDGTAA